MKKTITLLASIAVCFVPRLGNAQDQGRVETPITDQNGPGGDVRLVSGTDATSLGSVTHQFFVQRNGGYYSLFKMNNAGRVGIGTMASWELRSTLNVGTGMNSSSVDNFAGTTVGTGQNTTVGSACIGFNAARQLAS